jgi:hypothetical protein
MVDVTPSKKYLLASGTIFKVRLSTDTDYQIIQAITSGAVSIAPEGGEPLILEALDGIDTTVAQKIKRVRLKGEIWLAPNNIELLRTAYGEPVVTGTNPYVHTFTGGTIGQAIDFFLEGQQYGDTTKYVRVTGTNGAINFTNLGVELNSAWKYAFEILVGADTHQVIVAAATNLT